MNSYKRLVSSLLLLFATSTPAAAQALFEIVREGRYYSVVRALAEGSWTENDLSMGLVAAAGLNLPAAAEHLLEAGADPNYEILGGSVISTAVRENSAATLQVVLEAGGNPNQRLMYDWTPLHHAILADGARFQSLRTLLDFGAEVDARTSLGVTPLHRAAGFCSAPAVEALLNAGADPLLLEQYGRTAYQRSVEAGCPGIGGLEITP